jgi:FtsP/CotA-like multicopper oxidase with cupredoxin domain
MIMLIKELLKPTVVLLALIAMSLPQGALAQTPLDPATIPQFVTPLAIPKTMPKTATLAKKIDYYEIAVRQFPQQILPAPFPQTTVWGYGSINHPATFSYPAYTIEAKVNNPVRVKWINDLKDPVTGNFLPHLLPVDQTLNWANPPMDCLDMPGMPMTDCRGSSQLPYAGPVPIVTHLHGAHVGPDSDGHPAAWYLPAANNIPAGYAPQGSEFGQIPGVPAQAGAAVFEYPNDQRATTLWYHDHSMGMTRVNVYAGPAGFYLLRGGKTDLPTGMLPSGKYEIPLVIQDRAFNADGSLFFPDNRAYFEGLTPDQLQIPFIPEPTLSGLPSDIAPIWNPEFFGDTIVVNGQTWPFLNVEPKKYRLRLLNGSDSRFFILTSDKPLTFWQIGADGGFLPAPAAQTQLLIAPAERADVIVDFSAYKPGTTITLQNIGPDEPFGGGLPGVDFAAANPATTGKVMQFRVVKGMGLDTCANPATLALPVAPRLGLANNVRQVSLNEEESQTVFVTTDADGNIVESTDLAAVPFAPSEALLGSLDANGNPIPLEFMDAITENPALGATEVWEIYNFTADAHPIHIHLVQFEIIDRQQLETDADGMSMKPAMLVAGTNRPPEVWETGTKDTVIVYPGEMARVKAKFDIPGQFIWHCHILSHEDNEMMRPYYVGPIPAVAAGM